MSPVARVGTRGSPLALAQTAIVVARLRAVGLDAETVTITTHGDRARFDGSMMVERGAFVKDIEAALLGGEVDIAVHSAKDLPTDLSSGSTIAAFPLRGDARDAVVTRDGAPMSDLPAGARVGTESPRRQAFVRHERPDLRLVPIRGNVDTRLAKLDAGEVDALIVAAVGLERLGLADRIVEALSVVRMIPAVGQGALAVQTRAGSPWSERVWAIDDNGTRAEVTAERAFLRSMGGGCRAPFAAHGHWSRGGLAVEAAALSLDGGTILRDRIEGADADAESIGERLARRLLERGAASLAAEARA